MSYNIVLTDFFERQLKKLSKKYPSIKSDIAQLHTELKANPHEGDAIGHRCYKVRMAITSKGKGKSGGAKVITYVYVAREIIYLISIYDKSEKESISGKELQSLIALIK